MRALFAASALLALAACNKPAHTPVGPPSPVAMAPVAPPAPIAAPVSPPVLMAHYLCIGGKTLDAGYPSPTTVLVVWQDHAYTLTLSDPPPASGARYAGFGQQWLSEGATNATLSTLKPGETIASAPGLDCVAQIPGAIVAPGMPGALPDAAAQPLTGPTSAQGAADVVRNYYGLLGKRASVAAAEYRIDATPENLSQYAALSAQVGVPGVIVVTGPTLSVEVPVVLSGRMADGSALKKAGKAVLKRANDTPGSTPEQRTWRIDRISLK